MIMSQLLRPTVQCSSGREGLEVKEVSGLGLPLPGVRRRDAHFVWGISSGTSVTRTDARPRWERQETRVWFLNGENLPRLPTALMIKLPNRSAVGAGPNRTTSLAGAGGATGDITGQARSPFFVETREMRGLQPREAGMECQRLYTIQQVPRLPLQHL